MCNRSAPNSAHMGTRSLKRGHRSRGLRSVGSMYSKTAPNSNGCRFYGGSTPSSASWSLYEGKHDHATTHPGWRVARHPGFLYTDCVATTGLQLIVLGGGCFWCTEAVFSGLKGVHSVVPGYAGGTTVYPSYEQVCTGTMGHAEVVQVEFDPTVITLHDILTVFFATHDPTTKNRQGNDVGTQYRSTILCTSTAQKDEVVSYITALGHQNLFSAPVQTVVASLTQFFPAEEHHRDYFTKNPDRAYCQAVIHPKLEKFRKRFTKLLDQNKRSLS